MNTEYQDTQENINEEVRSAPMNYVPLVLQWKQQGDPDYWAIQFCKLPDASITIIGKPKFAEILDCLSRLVLPVYILAEVIAVVVAQVERDESLQRLR